MANRKFDGVKINVDFQGTANRQQISSGDDLNTLFGKIKKWLADLKMVAFSGSYNDLGDKPTIPTKVSEFENDENYVKEGEVPTVTSGGLHSAYGVAGVAGYVKFATLKITGSWVDQPISFILSKRFESIPSTVSVLFEGVNSKDPNLKSIVYQGNNQRVSIVKSSESTWDLYFNKEKESHDNITVFQVYKSCSSAQKRIEVEWKDEQVNSLPDGAIENVLDSGTPITTGIVGEIKSYMGTTPPESFLACDGAIYNIADYPYLTQHFLINFGKINFFGGDGVDTFAVPDLRGEFLRGTGTATRNTGSGASVGVHQNPTKHSATGSWHGTSENGWVGAMGGVPDINPAFGDNRDVSGGSSTGIFFGNIANTGSDYRGRSTWYTGRPTNTSVLYCIRYKPAFMADNEGMLELAAEIDSVRKKTVTVNNLLATEEGHPLDATQGKTLNDKIEELSSGFNYQILNPIIPSPYSGSIYGFRIGKLVTLNGNLYNTSGIVKTLQLTIGGIPHPQTSVGFPVSSTLGFGFASLSEKNVFFLELSSATIENTSRPRFNFSYITNEF